MFIVASSMSRDAVRRAGTQQVLDHSTSFRPAEPRRRLVLDRCYKHATATGVNLPCDFISLLLL